jgi:hypothetical protein
MSGIQVDYVRHKLLRILEADPRELYEPDPNDPTGKRHRLRSISNLPGHLASAIARLKIDPESGEPIDVVFAGKNEAAATLLRSLPGGSVDRHEISGKDGSPLVPVGPIINIYGRPEPDGAEVWTTPSNSPKPKE